MSKEEKKEKKEHCVLVFVIIKFSYFLNAFCQRKTQQIRIFLITLSDILSLYVAYHMFVKLFIVLVVGGFLVFLQYFMFLMCFKRINRRLLLLSGVAVLLSMFLEVLVCLRSLTLVMAFWYKLIFLIPEIIVLVVFPLTMTIKVIFLIALFVIRRFVSLGVEIPVSALERDYRGAINAWADKIPGL